MKYIGLLLTIFLVGCAASEQRAQQQAELRTALTDPRAEQMIELDIVSYYARAGAANAIAAECSSISFYRSLDLKFNERRMALGQGAFAAALKRKEIASAIDTYKAELATAYDVTFEGDEACVIGQRELDKQTPLSVLLNAN